MDAYCPTHGLIKAKVELGPKRSIKAVWCHCNLEASLDAPVVVVVVDEIEPDVEDDEVVEESGEEE